MVRTLGCINTRLLSLLLMACLGILPGCALLDEYETEKELISKIEKNRIKNELYSQGEDFYKLGELEKARENFEQLVEQFPDTIQASYRLGNIAFRQKRLDDAGKHFEKVVELKPRHAKAHYNLAMIRILQSEKHLKFYTAVVDPETDISAISKFLGDINNFSNALSQNNDKDELDDIVSVIDKRN